jgi:hypothetical protein
VKAFLPCFVNAHHARIAPTEIGGSNLLSAITVLCSRSATVLRTTLV